MASCICGHPDYDHPDGPCDQGTCECPAFAELCPQCIHAKADHGGGRCSRIIRRPGPNQGQPCGCTNYPAEQGGS